MNREEQTAIDVTVQNVEILRGRLEKAEKERDAAQAKLAELEQQEPVAWMLADAVGGSALEFQQHELIDIQRRYGGEIVPLYAAPVAQAGQVPVAEISRLYGTCWRGKQLSGIAPGTLLCAPVFRVESSASMTCLIGTAAIPHGTKLYEVTAAPEVKS
ncbi:hypothetical protein D3C78_549300 [compost metagenome]